MNITLNIQASPEFLKAIETLAASLTGRKEIGQVINLDGVSQQAAAQQPANAVPFQQQQPAPAAVPVQQPYQQPAPQSVPTAQYQAPPVQQQPYQQPAPAQQPSQAVPTVGTAPTYDMQQLAVAATQLMDAGRGNEIHQLFAAFGVQSLMQLPKEQYGAFATKLRELGARI